MNRTAGGSGSSASTSGSPADRATHHGVVVATSPAAPRRRRGWPRGATGWRAGQASRTADRARREPLRPSAHAAPPHRASGGPPTRSSSRRGVIGIEAGERGARRPPRAALASAGAPGRGAATALTPPAGPARGVDAQVERVLTHSSSIGAVAARRGRRGCGRPVGRGAGRGHSGGRPRAPAAVRGGRRRERRDLVEQRAGDRGAQPVAARAGRPRTALRTGRDVGRGLAHRARRAARRRRAAPPRGAGRSGRAAGPTPAAGSGSASPRRSGRRRAGRPHRTGTGSWRRRAGSEPGTAPSARARVTRTTPSSSGWRSPSSTAGWNSPSSSRNSTPPLASETSPGRMLAVPPPTMATSDAVWCGARSGGRRTSPPRQRHAGRRVDHGGLQRHVRRRARAAGRAAAGPASSCPRPAARPAAGGGRRRPRPRARGGP